MYGDKTRAISFTR